MLAVHEAFVRKVISVLKDYDNVMYEICNEPYFGGVTLEWQHHIADVIVDAERAFPHKHLITQNIANGKAKIETPHPAVSVFNFHYAQPPDTVALNQHLIKSSATMKPAFAVQTTCHIVSKRGSFSSRVVVYSTIWITLSLPGKRMALSSIPTPNREAATQLSDGR